MPATTEINLPAESTETDLAENDIHTMPDQFFNQAEVKTGSGKGKWIILGAAIFLFLGAAIAGAIYFFNRQAEPAVNQPLNNVNANLSAGEAGQNINQGFANANLNANSNAKTNASSSTTALRDTTRLSHISELRTSLANYFQTFQSFPNSLSDLVGRFIDNGVPQNPAPGGQDYVYAPASGNNNYSLSFSLEEGGVWGTARLPAGVYRLTAEGVLPAASEEETNLNTNGNNNTNTAGSGFVPGDGLDTDADGLSDIEENLYHTNSTLMDSDGDTFNDANELLNFYDPTKKDGRLMDSGLIKVYQNASYNYSLLYPASWVARSLSETETIFTSNTGEFTAITVQENTLSLSSYAWYLDKMPNADPSSLKNLNIDGLPAIQTADGLNAYLAVGSKVYIIAYNIGAQQQTNFKATYLLFLKSFMFVESPDVSSES